MNSTLGDCEKLSQWVSGLRRVICRLVSLAFSVDNFLSSPTVLFAPGQTIQSMITPYMNSTEHDSQMWKWLTSPGCSSQCTNNRKKITPLI